MVITRGNRIKKAGAKSEKKTWLNCTIQPFAREFFDGISPLQMLASNDSKTFLFCKSFMKTWQIISRILCINQDNLTFLGNKFTNSCSRNENCELYTQEVLKSTCIRSHYHLLIWRSRLWISDNFNLRASKLHGNRLPNI